MRKQDTFEAFIKQERTRLQKARIKAIQKKSGLDQELAAIERELAAITAYEEAKGGRPTRAGKRAAAKQAGRRTGGRRGRRGEKRQAVLNVVQQHPDGLTRGEILELMGVKGDKSGEQSVSNALTALSRQSQLARRESKYVPA